MKNYLIRTIAALGLCLALFTPVATKAADGYVAQTAAANTVSNILSAGGYLIKAITWINTSTNVATIKFYDTATTSTTMVQAAYTQFGTPYATNWVTTFTNSAGIVITNTTPGFYVPTTSVSTFTNERPKVLQLLVPASGQVVLTDINRSVSMGLSVLPNQAGTYLLTYSQLQ